MRDFGPDVASVAVLTPYKAQLVLLKSAFAGQHSKSALANVDFATVDGFQVTAESHAVHRCSTAVHGCSLLFTADHCCPLLHTADHCCALLSMHMLPDAASCH